MTFIKNQKINVARYPAHIHKYKQVYRVCCHSQGWTDNSWRPRAIGGHGAPVSLPKLKKAYEKGTGGISWGPLLTPGPSGS
ncbi:unnamed protein product, partial [Staurois parvus]